MLSTVKNILLHFPQRPYFARLQGSDGDSSVDPEVRRSIHHDGGRVEWSVVVARTIVNFLKVCFLARLHVSYVNNQILVTIGSAELMTGACKKGLGDQKVEK